MKLLLLLLLLLTFISCKPDVTEENFDFGAWIEENRIPQHEHLISVEEYKVSGIYSISEKCEIEKFEQPSEVKLKFINDTIIAEYCIGHDSDLGQDIFDITIKKDTVCLLYDFVYTPMTDEITIELIDHIPTIKRVYKILNNDGRFDNKKWVVGSGTLVDEKAYKKLKSDAEK
jgi:hypothetical protein